VAKLAGIPEAVVTRAREILSNLEKEELDPAGRPRLSRKKENKKRLDEPFQTELFGYPGDEILKELDGIDPNGMTPIEALNLLTQWKGKYST
jgi:DNA mismatch repair protein MutS